MSTSRSAIVEYGNPLYSLRSSLTLLHVQGDIAYLLSDISGVTEADIAEIYEAVSQTADNISTRMLF